MQAHFNDDITAFAQHCELVAGGVFSSIDSILTTHTHLTGFLYICQNSFTLFGRPSLYTKEALLDLNLRAHKNLRDLLDHCRQLNNEELNRSIPGFGLPTVREQLCHEIGANEYWIGVLLGQMLADENLEDYPDIDSLEQYRLKTFNMTADYLNSSTPQELNTERKMISWGGNERMLKPALVVMRTLTHLYHHQGQVLAMCRILGKPGGGVDFPIIPID